MIQNRFQIFEATFDGTNMMKLRHVETTYNTITNKDYRFEGQVHNNAPFGFGHLYSKSKGNLIYYGIMIGWKRFGFGQSYYSFGIGEYYGYWINDQWNGPSVMHNTKEMYKSNWLYGISLGKYSAYELTGLQCLFHRDL